MRYNNDELTEIARSALQEKELSKDNYTMKIMFLSAMSGVPVEDWERRIENYSKGVFDI